MVKFELFDRDTVAGTPVDAGPSVRIDQAGRLLFSRGAWAFMAMQGSVREVGLAYDVETRTVAVRPSGVADAPGTRWEVRTMRSMVWPCGVNAAMFVRRYRLTIGEWPARLLRGPGPRMVTFDAGACPNAPAADDEPRLRGLP